jgi:hypothetical protein
MASSRNDAHFPGLGGGTATNISAATPQPNGTAAAGSTGDVSDAGHIHRLSYLSELNAWGVPTSYNATTNSPALTSGTANTTNTAFIVTTAGSSTPDSIGAVVVGDTIYFDAAAGIWKKLSVEAFDTSTWAARGSGVYTGQVKRITDLGGAGGTLFMWDGTVWRPSAGGICIKQRWGTVASPIDTNTGDTGSLFTLPEAISFPAGLIPSHSHIHVRARVKRTGANATANFECYLGTAGTSSDSILGRLALSAVDAHIGAMETQGFFGTSTTAFVSNGAAKGQDSTAASSFTDRSTNVNTASAMTLTLGMASANAADSFALVGYAVWLYT